ncbi:MAG: hypothetical protein GF334_06480 [Candidatus Altiarchaeales archaeon]|nr:hypothetical protein [Candidatus Altiarchaeales archaeon]
MIIIGADENGWGPIAGPLVVTAAVGDVNAITCRDSKKYPRSRIHDVAKKTKEDCITSVSLTASATRLGSCQRRYEDIRRGLFFRAIYECRRRIAPRYPDTVIDGNDSFGIRYAQGLPHADNRISIVGAASCIGKSTQLKWMLRAHRLFPEYGFDQHAGYATKLHCASLVTHGMIPGIHRVSRCMNWARRRGINLRFNGDPSYDYSADL